MSFTKSVFADQNVVYASAIDSDTVKIREDAMSIEYVDGEVHLSVFILDTTEEDIRNHSYQSLHVTRGFNRNWSRPALQVTMVVKPSGHLQLREMKYADVLLDATYDRNLTPEDEVTEFLDRLGLVAAMLTGRPYEETVRLPKVGLTAVITETNALLARSMHQTKRGLVYMNSVSGPHGDYQSFSPIARGHEKLGLAVYARFTSPCLRYDDEVNYAALKAAISYEPDPFTPADLAKAAHLCSFQRGKKPLHAKVHEREKIAQPQMMRA